MRDTFASGATNDLQKMAVVGIENLQAVARTNSVVYEITARSAKPDLAYTDPTYGDHYHGSGKRAPSA